MSTSTHSVTVDEAHYSKVHLGFDNDLWAYLMMNYIRNRMGLDIDFSQVHQFDDPYCRLYDNLPLRVIHQKMDIETALADFLDLHGMRVVKWKSIPGVMTKLKYWDLSIPVGSTFLYMLRNYMTKYHSDLCIEWCEHSKRPYDVCYCLNFLPDVNEQLDVNMLTLFCNRHAERKGW
jgi:hypothetical protein